MAPKGLMSVVAGNHRRPVLAFFAVVGATAALLAVPLQDANAVATKSASKITLSEDIAGTASGGVVTCTDSGAQEGQELGLTLGRLKVHGKRYTLSVVLAGTSWMPFIQLAADQGGAWWASGPAGGTLTLSKDKMSGRFGAELTSSTGTGTVQVKGSFSCAKRVRVAGAPAPAA